MNDDEIEKLLRELPRRELPASWRDGILFAARREAAEADEARAAKRDRAVWPPLLVALRNLWVRNPETATALATMWMLIFLFRATTPVDLASQAMLANYDPNRPVYIVSLREQIELARLLENPPESAPPPQIP